MEINELRYRCIETDGEPETKMVDLFLARALGRDNYRIFRKKNKADEYAARFWATDSEFQMFEETLTRYNDERIDYEYEMLLAEQ